MRFDVLTVFPGMFAPVLGESIIGRAIKAGYIELGLVDIRAFSRDKHARTDDYPYGGGSGMVMTPQPLYDAWRSVSGTDAAVSGITAAATVDVSVAPSCRARTVYMSPQGAPLTQKKALELSREPHLILVCGHYEGVDERVIELIADEEISVGDYVLTGGELPAMTLIDCVSRLVPGVLPTPEAYMGESHFDGLLEYPQYTRPPEFMGLNVPAVLLTGHHDHITRWRHEQSVGRTKRKRPDILAAPRRRIALAGADNMRDLGGYPAGEGLATRWRTFFRADLLANLTRADVGELRELGITTVIDLRTAEEAERDPEPFVEADGFLCHRIAPLSLAAMEKAIPGKPFKELYIRFAEHGAKKFAKVFRLLADSRGACLIHCHAGKDRTGIVAALLLLLAGVAHNDVVADYQVSGTYIRASLSANAPQDGIDPETGLSPHEYARSSVATIEYFLAYIGQKYGGAEGYLRAVGVTEDDIAAIRQKFLVPAL